MFAKLKELREEREGGFTLIELLVVILIIGILAAIAIPLFLNQRKSAVDSSVQSDVKNAATQIESAIIKTQGTIVDVNKAATSPSGPAGGDILLTTDSPAKTYATATLKIGSGTTLTIKGTSSAYCIQGVNAGGDSSSTGIVYKSDAGGLQSGAGTCS